MSLLLLEVLIILDKPPMFEDFLWLINLSGAGLERWEMGDTWSRGHVTMDLMP